MSVLLQHPSSKLLEISAPVTVGKEDLSILLGIMIDVMYSHEGVGLAAPQVGSLKHVLVLDPSGGTRAGCLRIIINPEKVSQEGTQVHREGCLSLPGVTENVERARAVTFDFWDVTTSSQQRSTFVDWEAQILQHELDHLSGILFWDRVSSLKRRELKKQYGRGNHEKI